MRRALAGLRSWTKADAQGIELKTASQIAAEELADPGICREHERTALAHAVAIRVIGYRVGHGLSQSGLARVLGMHQPAIARREADDREPSLAALAGWRECLEYHIDIAPDVFELRGTA